MYSCEHIGKIERLSVINTWRISSRGKRDNIVGFSPAIAEFGESSKSEALFRITTWP